MNVSEEPAFFICKVEKSASLKTVSRVFHHMASHPRRGEYFSVLN
jgi:hypothetical protein